MSIHLKIATEIRRGALLAAAEATTRMPDGISPALTEVAQIHAAIVHVAGQVHDVPEGVLRQRVLIALSEQCGPGAAITGSATRSSATSRRWVASLVQSANHWQVPRSVPCDRCNAIGQEPRL